MVRAWEARTATAGRGPLKFATFTQRTDASETPAQAFDRMRRHLARFMRAPRVREWFAGGGALAFFEFTWKAGRG